MKNLPHFALFCALRWCLQWRSARILHRLRQHRFFGGRLRREGTVTLKLGPRPHYAEILGMRPICAGRRGHYALDIVGV